MEPENENVQPTRSLFGGPVSATAPSSEDSTVGVDASDNVTSTVEESVAENIQPEPEPAVAEEEVVNEPEPEATELQEAQPVLENDLVSEAVEPTVEAVLEASDAQDDQSFGSVGNEVAVATTLSTEDITPSVEDTATEAPELPEIAKLKAEREKLDAAIQNKQLEERKSVISQIAAVVKLYDIPLLELFTNLGGIPNPRKGEKAPITHKDDQGNKWTGRGRTPRWLKGKNPEDYRIK